MNEMPDTEAVARQVNGHLGQLCELTYRCLQASDAGEPDVLVTLLDRRQVIMSEIDRLQHAGGFPDNHPAAFTDDGQSRPAEAAAAAGCGIPPDMHRLEIERRDLIHLLASLDGELIRLSARQRDAFHADLQNAMNAISGPKGNMAAGRLFSRIG